MTDATPLSILWRQRWLLVAVVAVSVAAAALATASLPRIYSATSTLLVTVAANDQTYDTVQASQAYARSYRDIIASPNVAQLAADRLGDGADGHALQAAVRFEAVPETQLLTVTAEDPIPQRAKRIADAYAVAFSDYARRNLGERTKAAIASWVCGPHVPSSPCGSRWASGRKVLPNGWGWPAITVADAAPLPDQPVRPKPALYVLVAAILGFAFACALAFARHRFDRRLRGVGDVESRIAGDDLPILARIPLRGRSEQSIMAFEEAHRVLRKNLEFASTTGRLRSIAVTSAEEGEGKTTTVTQLAKASAELNLRVVIVGADFRRPDIPAALAPIRQLAVYPGLSSYLIGAASLDAVIHATVDPGIEIIPAGPPPPSGSALLESDAARDLVPELLRRADLLLVDCPPVNAGAGASSISGKVDGVIVVVDLTRSTDRTVSAALRQLRAVRSSLLGLVINRDSRIPVARDNGHAMAAGGRAPVG